MKTPHLISGFRDTRLNNEYFAITPYLAVYRYNGTKIFAMGISLTWGWYSVMIGVGTDIPKEDRFFFDSYKPETT